MDNRNNRNYNRRFNRHYNGYYNRNFPGKKIYNIKKIYYIYPKNSNSNSFLQHNPYNTPRFSSPSFNPTPFSNPFKTPLPKPKSKNNCCFNKHKSKKGNVKRELNFAELLKKYGFEDNNPDVKKYKIPQLREKNINIDIKKTFPNNIVLSSNIDKKEFEYITEPIYTLADLIHIGELYPTKYMGKNTNINTEILYKLKDPLQELENMIGLEKVKENIFNLVIYYLQKLDNKNKDFLHIVIEGMPGVGKTELAKIFGKIFTAMGILSKGTFTQVKRSDLIGGYLGQTAIKTRGVLEGALGGVLFIDEAYSLGNKEGKDSYSKECIDTLTAFLSENKGDFICIIAGYKDSLKKCFFSYNRGLERRFPYCYSLPPYKPIELKEIFLKLVKDNGWEFHKDSKLPLKFFKKNKHYFLYNGGDMELLFHKCKVAHSIRIMSERISERKKLTYYDIEEGFKSFIGNENIKERNKEHREKIKYLSMYT